MMADIRSKNVSAAYNKLDEFCGKELVGNAVATGPEVIHAIAMILAKEYLRRGFDIYTMIDDSIRIYQETEAMGAIAKGVHVKYGANS